MVYGIGLDMIETERIEAAASESFLNRVFSDRERLMLSDRGNGAQQIAGCWAGKEALIKAMGEGFTSLKDIEVLRKPSGMPFIVLNGETKAEADRIGITNIHISITNLKELVAAMVVLEKD